MLEMKNECLQCNIKLEPASDAMICSYECTYCLQCASENNGICKNCGGDLQLRPKRKQGEA
ncbi:MAG: DUF1272 domain-containing protein [Candidatus Dadabacteria bacterium]|nr:DUF1272 domain-containing protein [Candidatus Dadabacteria bacterium]